MGYIQDLSWISWTRWASTYQSSCSEFCTVHAICSKPWNANNGLLHQKKMQYVKISPTSLIEKIVNSKFCSALPQTTLTEEGHRKRAQQLQTWWPWCQKPWHASHVEGGWVLQHLLWRHWNYKWEGMSLCVQANCKLDVKESKMSRN